MMGARSSDRGSDQAGAGALVFEPPHPGVYGRRGRARGTWSPVTDAILLASLALLVFCAFYAAATSPQVGPVRSWRVVSGPRDIFSIEAPIGWQVIRHSEPGTGDALIIRRSRWVHVFIEVYPELGEEVARWGMSAGSLPADLLAYMHLLTGKMLVRQFPGVSEGRSAPTQLGGVPAIWSRLELNEQGGIYAGVHMTGIRATLAYGPAGLVLVAIAPTESWDEFEPIALHVFRSIRFRPLAAAPPSASPNYAAPQPPATPQP